MRYSFVKTVTERQWLIQNALATGLVWGVCWFMVAFRHRAYTGLFPAEFYNIYVWVVIPVIIALLAWITFGGHYFVRFLLYNLAIYGAWRINIYVELGIHRDSSSEAFYWVLDFLPSVVGANVAFFVVAAIAWLLQKRARNRHT
jgi:hypothetical protein